MQKNGYSMAGWSRHGIIKLVLMMKLVIVFVFLCSFQALAVKSLGQNIDLNLKNVTIETVLKQIEAQADYRFVYKNEILPQSNRITIQAQNATLRYVMSQLFKNTALSYQIMNNKLVVIVRKSDDYRQPAVVSGTVTDRDKVPLAGVSVIEKGTSNGTVSRKDGTFSLTIGNDHAVLAFSSIGYVPKEVTVASNETGLTVILEKIENELDQVVVIGYGTQKKVNMSGAVSQVQGEDLVNRPVPNLTSALQGVVPGLSVLRSSGQPGSEGYGIRIRGFTSTNNANALVLVDGIEQDLNLIDPNDVASISVLKDASAAAIYGARAASGVILVTTKSGSPGKTKVDFNGYYGLNITARRPERLNSWDEQLLINESRQNATGTPEFNEEQMEWLKNPNFSYRPNPTQDRWEYFGNNNWVMEGMDKVNHMQNYSLSVGGGDRKLNYLVSGSYYKRDGVLRYGPDDNSRYNLKLNLNAELNQYISMKAIVGYIGSITNENAFGTEQIINRLYRSRARQSLYTPEEDITGQPYNGDLQINAVDIEKNAGSERRLYETFTGRLGVQVKNLVKGLTFDMIGWRNQNNYNMENNRRSLFWYGRSTNTVRFSANVPNSITQTKNRAYQNNLQGYFTYNIKLGAGHNLKLMQGASYEEYRKDQVTASAQNMINNDAFSLNFGDPLSVRSSEVVETWALASAFGRLNYDFLERYIFEASYRYDGSSRLAPENRWALFPSFSTAWRVSEEGFFKNHINFIDNLKLRGSWGRLGNGSPLGLYPYIPLLTSGLTGDNGTLVFNDQRTQYFYQGTLASPSVTWETVQQFNLGLDLAVLQNRLSVTADYYVKKNINMLAALSLPNIIGVNVPMFNVGELKSWGTELDLRWRDNAGSFDYTVGFNISDNQNKLLKYDARNSVGSGGLVELMEGYPINSVWGYKTDGYFQTQEAYDQYKATVNTPFFPNNAGAGDVKYLDLNGDGVISAGEGTPQNSGDLVMLGTTNARYSYGFDLGFNYKGLDFSIFFQGALKRAFLISEGTLSPMLGTADMPWTIHMDRWTPDNPEAYFPRMYQTSAHNYRASDKWVQNGNYLRLKNAQIGYNLPFKNRAIQNIKIYVSGQDLWEVTKVMKVFDPEVGNNVSATTYPFYRTVSFGLNMSL